ncbi:glutathione S-transferase [Coprinopsis marcescibilis]|uniref:glutathione transferase n=1 Tax=Coprinopsis marcescibilis TaxID=230819 RepID=A0A5C3L752_COPMA|nr:glutathione S-transferase [Coprinopsis marcescibilis]
MILKLYGIALSPNVQRAAMVLREKKVPFEFHSVDLSKGEHKSPEYKEKNPFGSVPYLDDNGFVIFESRAIARYVEDKFSGQGRDLIPKDPKKRALFEQAAAYEHSRFDRHATPFIHEKFWKPFIGQTTDEHLAKYNLERLEQTADVYEVILSKQKYLAGDEITLADLLHLPYGTYLPTAGADIFSTRPNLARWFKDLSEQPSWLAVKDGVATFTG